MFSPSEVESRLDELLLQVQKPGRYVGGEYNSISKDWDSTPVKIALVFPELYDIGISNLGLQILYNRVNRRPDALAERAYAPWVDMEAQMRQHGLPLYSLETKHPLACFDIVGFSLPYETLYTNTLNLLDLAGIPVRWRERTAGQPLVIAGGHACFNPEPMHAFIDAFIVGEGESALDELIDACRDFKQQEGDLADREGLLRRLAGIPGIYVPRFYEVSYHPDGTVARVFPTVPEAPAVVTKRIEPVLPPPETRFLVPNIEGVHNRVSVEVMRGCTRGCRFCQAGMITRPVRERSVDEVVQAVREAIDATGFEEVALLSLSSSDFSNILPLVERLGIEFGSEHLSISLPSLRIDTVSVDLVEKLKSRRSSGFTLAPEAATERMQRIINKPIPADLLVETARQVYSHSWTNLKLYFMIGLPGETMDDIQGIIDLCKRVLAEGRSVLGGKARLHASVGTFIPKPHTPFQWAALDSPDLIRQKQDLLLRALRGPAIKVSWVPPEDTLLEAWLSRGDRRMAEVIHSAWKHGTRFDAWQDQRCLGAWETAFTESGLDPSFYTQRPRLPEEVFPWEHVSSSIRRKFLYAEFLRSQNGETLADCRLNCFACGILPAFASERRSHPGDAWKCPEVRSPSRTGNLPADTAP